jgi:hypothetical protein
VLGNSASAFARLKRIRYAIDGYTPAKIVEAVQAAVWGMKRGLDCTVACYSRPRE